MSVRAFYKTKAGSELPLLSLRGKEYLQVAHRLVWLREEKPGYRIETELVRVDDNSALAKAIIRDESGNIVAMAHKFEDRKGFADFIEKAETGAVGRALLMIGYGTAFCADELDEGSRLADSPVDPVGMTKVDQERKELTTPTVNNKLNQSNPATSASALDDPKNFKITFGRKYKDKTLGELPRSEAEAYIKWLMSSAVRDGTSLSFQVTQLINAYERIYGKQEWK